MIDRGQIYKLFEQGRYEDVLTFFSKNLPQIPDDYNLKALSLYNIGLVQEAVEILRYGLTAFPQNKDLLFNMIEILYTAREYEEVKNFNHVEEKVFILRKSSQSISQNLNCFLHKTNVVQR